MNWPQNSSLQSTLEGIAPPRVLIGHKIIVEGDEQALLAEERGAFAGSVVKVRRASGAARMVARELMRRVDVKPQPVIKADGGMPIWPDGLVGSLAHDATVAVAALARRDDYLSIGIDIEPAEPLDPDLLDMVATPGERAAIQESIEETFQKTIQISPLHGRLLFAIKEAVYKAAYPLDRVFLDHHDVEVDLAARTAAIRDGRTVRFACGQSSHIAVLAYIPVKQTEPSR
jgi:4'-phosphopantetheinyl transferase EntD